MTKIKDVLLAGTLTYSIFATYLISNNSSRIISNSEDNSRVYIEKYDDSISNVGSLLGEINYNGILLPLYYGPNGPRLGNIEYIARNLTHSEKIMMSEELLKVVPDIATRTLSDIWNNRERIVNDITSKIDSIIRGD